MKYLDHIPLLLLSIIFVFIFNSCKKDPNKEIKYDWATNGTKLFYDRYTATNTIKNSLTFTIVDNTFQGQSSPSIMINVLESKFKVKKGGLYSVDCNECPNSGFFYCLTTTDYLYLPNSAALNQKLPVYSCGKIDYTNRVIGVDKTITVPQGTYITFLVESENGDLSYWNADYGLIMYETIRTEGKIIYKLSKTSKI